VTESRHDRMDAEIKKSIDARTKEFKEKLAKLTYGKIKQALVPSAEPLKGYPHNESIEESDSKEYQISLDMLAKLVKGDPKKAASFIKRTAALSKGGGWNMAQKPSKRQKDQWNKMTTDHKKKHRGLYASYNEELEEVSEMTHRFVFDKAVNLGKAEKLAQKFGLKTDSETQSNYYYLSVDDGGNTNNFMKWLKATDGLHEQVTDALTEMNARYEISDMEQSKDPEVKKQYAKLKKAKYPSMQYIRQYKEVEAALDKSLPANKRKK